MSHSNYCRPRYLWMFRTELFGEHVGCFAYNLNKFYETIKYDRVIFCGLEIIFVFII